MKKLVYFFVFLFTVSCNRDINPNAAPDLKILAKQQAPFGAAASDVKLRQVLQNNQVSVEYIYEWDLLAGEKRFDASNTKFYQQGTFTRVNNLPESYVVASAYDGQGDSATIYKPFYSLIFTTPRSDSIRQVKYQRSDGTENYLNTYAFDKDGFITRQEFWTDLQSNIADVIVYVRNKQHNVSETWNKKTSGPKPDNWAAYTYDDHPNPFFTLGRDWNGEISVRSLSPNNLVKETYKNAIGITSNISYTYEYLPNGYPKKVTIRVESVNYQPWSYSLDFVY